MPQWTWYGPPVYRYRDERGRFVALNTIQDWASQSISNSQAAMGDLAAQLSDGSISLQQWQTEMRARLRQDMIQQYTLGRGGIGEMTPQDNGSIGGVLAEQYRYLDGFAERIAAGQHSEAQIAALSRMYFNSTHEAFERAMARSRGFPDDVLPAYPGDGGSCLGLTNCGCHWDYHYVNGRWECTWTLGVTEHCELCLDHAATWAPLIVSATGELL